MPISVDQFRSAAAQLGDDADINLRTDQKGVATGKWQRFKVWVGDLISGKDAVATRQRQVVISFLDSIRSNYGDQMANIASDRLRNGFQGGPLTGRAVHDALVTIENHGGQHWLKNERLTRDFAHTVYPARETNLPSVSSVVNPIAESLIDDAVQKGLPRNKAAEFFKRYTTASVQAGAGFDMPNVSHAIETALRDTAQVKDDNGRSTGRFRALDPIEARQIASDAAKTAILNSINLEMGGNYLEQHPFEGAFDQMCNERGLSNYRKHMDLPLVEETFSFALQAAKKVVATGEMPHEVDRVLARYFDRQEQKLEQIKAMNLPQGPAREHLIAQSLGVRSRMDRAYFGEVGKIGDRFEQLAKDVKKEPDSEKQTEFVMAFGKAILKTAETLKVEGADDISRFLDQAFAVFAATAGPEGVKALRSWVGSEAGRQVQEAMADHMMNPDEQSLQQLGSLMYRTLQIVSVTGAELENE